MITLFRDLFSPPRQMILLLLAIWIGLTLAEKHSQRHNVGRDDLNNITFYGLIAFVIGGRLSFILQNLPAFMKSPLGIISINPDIFDPLGAVAVAAITVMIYCQRHRIPLWNALDALTPYFAILSIGIGLSHLAAGTAFGMETDFAWGIDLWNAHRHPTQIYETAASLLIFVLIWFQKKNSPSGILFLGYAASSAFAQLIIQAFRGDSTLIFNNLRQGQILAWVVLAATFLLFEYRLRKE